MPIQFVPLSDETGQRTHWISVQRDITERKLAELALLKNQGRYRALFQENPLPMWVYDDEALDFLAVNDAACRQYG
ncbi:MAG: PAS domain-containing protein [Candidatus Protistobacter heckmanni]|nr:PAS domain-containing protein [Candidatus Protistobacter heckmanni]